jgi:DNA-binding NarL/FixJ family response regulator
MIRILIIDDQKLVLQRLKELIESKQELEIVGVAENGQQGIEQVKQLQPDVAIIDLHMPLKNGIATTYFITQNYPQTQVIILTGSDGRMLNKAILAGAKGYLLKNSTGEDLIASIYAVKRHSIYIGKGILDPLQLPSVNEQASKLANINLLIAKEIVNYWREYSDKKTLKAQEIIQALGLDDLGLSWMKNYLCQAKDNEVQEVRLTEELELIVDKLFTQVENSAYTYSKVLEKKQQVANWFNGKNSNHTDSESICLDKLKKNYQFLRTKNLENLHKLITSLSQQMPPLPLLKCLRSLVKHLLTWQLYFETEKKQNLAKEKSAENSFFYLVSQLSKSQKKQHNKRKIYKKAMVFIYRCKINTEVNKLLARLILEIIQKLKIYIDSLNKTNQLLLNLSQKLEQTQQINMIVSTQIFEQLQKNQLPHKLKHDFEKWTGHSLNQWGIHMIDLEFEIKARLLEKLKPITQKLYFCLCRDALAISFLEYTELD